MQKIHLKPGMIHFSSKPCGVQVVVTFGLCLTIFDSVKSLGGACHFLYPFRQEGKPSTPLFAAPAIVGLVRAFEEAGSNLQDLEVHLYGAAHPAAAAKEYLEHCQNNVYVATEILDKKEIEISSSDVGGSRGRKIAFDCLSGETMIAKVDGIRSVDWMLNPAGPIERDNH